MITIIAIVCSLGAPDDCQEQTVTSSDFSDVSIASCLMGAPQLAEWMKDHPDKRLAGWKCVVGSKGRDI